MRKHAQGLRAGSGLLKGAWSRSGAGGPGLACRWVVGTSPFRGRLNAPHKPASPLWTRAFRPTGGAASAVPQALSRSARVRCAQSFPLRAQQVSASLVPGAPTSVVRFGSVRAWGTTRSFWSSSEYEYVGLDMVKLLLAANGLVFSGWILLPQRVMRENFISNLRNLQEGRVWTLITPAFSHQNPFHFLFNGMALMVMGTPVMHAIGPKRFLLLYLAAGFASCVGHLIYVNEMKPRIQARNNAHYHAMKRYAVDEGALGMSGSVMGISILYATLFPGAVLFLYGMVPVRAPIMVGLFIAVDLYFALSAPHSGTSHAGHLGGALLGAIYAFMLRRRSMRR